MAPLPCSKHLNTPILKFLSDTEGSSVDPLLILILISSFLRGERIDGKAGRMESPEMGPREEEEQRQQGVWKPRTARAGELKCSG